MRDAPRTPALRTAYPGFRGRSAASGGPPAWSLNWATSSVSTCIDQRRIDSTTIGRSVLARCGPV